MKISSVNYPIRIAQRDTQYRLFNTKTFETIFLDKKSMNIYNRIQKDCLCDEDLAIITEDIKVNKNEMNKLIEFLAQNKFIKVLNDE